MGKDLTLILFRFSTRPHMFPLLYSISHDSQAEYYSHSPHIACGLPQLLKYLNIILTLTILHGNLGWASKRQSSIFKFTKSYLFLSLLFQEPNDMQALLNQLQVLEDRSKPSVESLKRRIAQYQLRI